MLREHWQAAGYEKNFVVYDTVDQKALVKTVLKELNIDSKEYPVNYLLSIISKEKEADFGPEEYIQREGRKFSLKGHIQCIQGIPEGAQTEQCHGF